MTDLSAYEQALVERVARAMTPARYEDPFASSYVKAGFEQAARSALSALGLIGPSRTAWIAPWEATGKMEEAAYMAGGVGDNGGHEDASFHEQWAAIRDMHTTGKAERGLWSLMVR